MEAEKCTFWVRILVGLTVVGDGHQLLAIAADRRQLLPIISDSPDYRQQLLVMIALIS